MKIYLIPGNCIIHKTPLTGELAFQKKMKIISKKFYKIGWGPKGRAVFEITSLFGILQGKFYMNKDEKINITTRTILDDTRNRMRKWQIGSMQLQDVEKQIPVCVLKNNSYGELSIFRYTLRKFFPSKPIRNISTYMI